jgi:hypothetical protein
LLSDEPKNTRQREERACRVLREIYSRIDPNLFVLCSIAAPYTKFAALVNSQVVSSLQKWWKSISIFEIFIQLATQLSQKYSLHALVYGCAHSDCAGSEGCNEPDHGESSGNYEHTAQNPELRSVQAPISYAADDRRRLQSAPRQLEDAVSLSYNHGFAATYYPKWTSENQSLRAGKYTSRYEALQLERGSILLALSAAAT